MPRSQTTPRLSSNFRLLSEESLVSCPAHDSRDRRSASAKVADGLELACNHREGPVGIENHGREGDATASLSREPFTDRNVPSVRAPSSLSCTRFAGEDPLHRWTLHAHRRCSIARLDGDAVDDRGQHPSRTNTREKGGRASRSRMVVVKPLRRLAPRIQRSCIIRATRGTQNGAQAFECETPAQLMEPLGDGEVRIGLARTHIAQRRVARNVVVNVTVEHPIARGLSRPGQLVGLTRIGSMRDFVVCARPNEAEIEPVQMHRVQHGDRVENAPADLAAARVGEPFGSRVRAPIDRFEKVDEVRRAVFPFDRRV